MCVSSRVHVALSGREWGVGWGLLTAVTPSCPSGDAGIMNPAWAFHSLIICVFLLCHICVMCVCFALFRLHMTDVKYHGRMLNQYSLNRALCVFSFWFLPNLNLFWNPRYFGCLSLNCNRRRLCACLRSACLWSESRKGRKCCANGVRQILEWLIIEKSDTSWVQYTEFTHYLVSDCEKNGLL